MWQRITGKRLKFEGKVIIITGGGTGIGKTIAKSLVVEGAKVCIIGRTEDKLKKAKKEIEREVNLNTVYYYVCDVSLSEQVEETFKKINHKLGAIYGLVNCAAVNPAREDILNTSNEAWRETININLSGAFYCSKAVIKQMLKIGKGSIVNISSIAGITALKKRTAYMSSKFGLIGLTKSLALDFSSKKIRINAVCPGYVKTDLVANFLSSLPAEEYSALVNAHPLGGIGETKDISKAVIFLLSDEASWITGAVLSVDGGYTLGK